MRLCVCLEMGLVLAASVPLAGCASGSQASAGAASGAKSGAIGGVVAGAVGALLWGGNPLEAAVKVGITGAAAGAAVGAVAGAEADAQAKQAASQPPPAQPAAQPTSAELAELRAKMGEQAWDAAVLLAHCRHAGAIAAAEAAYAAESDGARRVYALLVEALAAEESGDRETAAALYPRIVAADPTRGSEEAVRAQVLEGVMKLQRLRQDNGLPALCPAP